VNLLSGTRRATERRLKEFKTRQWSESSRGRLARSIFHKKREGVCGGSWVRRKSEEGVFVENLTVDVLTRRGTFSEVLGENMSAQGKGGRELRGPTPGERKGGFWLRTERGGTGAAFAESARRETQGGEEKGFGGDLISGQAELITLLRKLPR